MVYPATTLQTGIVHLMRNSLDFASWKDRKPLPAAIKPIHTAPSAQTALGELDAFEQGSWGVNFPTVVGAWRRVCDKEAPFFAFPPEVRRVIYTTNAIDSGLPASAPYRRLPGCVCTWCDTQPKGGASGGLAGD